MLHSPTEAAAIISRQLRPLPVEDCGLDLAHGRVLRRPIVADRPLPPFDRVTMDGFAVRAADWGTAPPLALQVIGFQAAGMMAQALSDPQNAIEIATGAILPDGADAVIPYEDVCQENGLIKLRSGTSCRVGQNIHREGSDFSDGAELVPAGIQLTGREIAVAATAGAAQLQVAARPSVALVATGDELVEVDAPLIAPQQIRKSNDHAMHAALAQSQLAGRIERFHLRDHRPEIEAGLRRILAEFDVVILTGGISKGKLDHVPRALTDLGVTKHLQGIAQRPGKPLWFGTTPRHTPVFALPGNPVSTYTCLHRYVLPALQEMTGVSSIPPETVILAEAISFDRPMALMLPVRIVHHADGRQIAHPAPFNTSGDVGGLLDTAGFVELPADRDQFDPGMPVTLWRWT